MKRLVVLGSTGSVGRQVLDVVRQNPDNFTILGLSNGNNSKLLSHTPWKPRYTLRDGITQAIEWMKIPENLMRYKPEQYNV